MGPAPSQEIPEIPCQTAYASIGNSPTGQVSFTPETSSTSKKKNYKPFPTPFSAIWSIKNSTSIEPDIRSNTCYSYWPEKDSLFIAYGVSSDDTYYNDGWLLNFQDMKWSQIFPTLLSPRAGSRCILIDSTLFIFGGHYNNQYFADLHSINLNSGNLTLISTTGTLPPPRTTCVFVGTHNSLIVWGGHNGSDSDLSSIYILNLGTLVWSKVSCDEIGRESPSYSLSNSSIYICGSAKNQGLMKISLDDYSLESIVTTGNEPNYSIEDSSMVAVDRYLFTMGGNDIYDHTFLYAYDIERKWWFIFYLKPDEITVNYEDGKLIDIGYFLLPNDSSFAFVYRSSQRQLISCMGTSSKSSPLPISVLSIGDALSILHHRNDMFSMLHFDEHI